MTSMNSAESLAILALVALLPALIYLVWVRRAERYHGEGWSSVLGAFAYGALFATITAGILEAVIVALGTSITQRYPGPEFVFLNRNSTAGAFFLVLVIAPFVEEALKGSGVLSYGDRIRQPSDGAVFGASVGLGFGFFETFLYGIGAFVVGGLVAGLALILVRSLSSVLLHGSSTGMLGHGFARAKFTKRSPGTGAYYLLAVAMHASFNALASLTVLLAVFHIGGVAVDLASVFALVAAMAFAFGAIEHVRTVIQHADYPALGGPRTSFAPRRVIPPKR
ncbi:MAG TPA: PrsW family intramembrane metalloprotease [Thermoplasmata archaeon]|nr:PrsW family intramembrane metalloprotease [Thermoplasmata archaeon]